MSAKLLRRIERYLYASRTAASTFGAEVARDPHLVFDLRGGRALRAALTEKIEAHLDAQEARLEGARCRRR